MLRLDIVVLREILVVFVMNSAIEVEIENGLQFDYYEWHYCTLLSSLDVYNLFVYFGNFDTSIRFMENLPPSLMHSNIIFISVNGHLGPC